MPEPDPVQYSEKTAQENAFAPFLTPIEGAEGPCGPSLRYSGPYDGIREARRQDQTNLPQGVWETEIKQADWRAVERLCCDALQTKSKDLNIAAWLMEAWLIQQGPSGLAHGLRLMVALLTEFWDQIHPPIEEDEKGPDYEFRVSPFVFIVNEFPILLRLSPLTDPKGADAQKMCLDDWDTALRIENLARRDPDLARQEATRRADRAQFETSVAHTSTQALKARHQELSGAEEALADLDALLETHCGNAAPSFAPLRDVLGSMKAVLETALTARGWSVMAPLIQTADEEPDAEAEAPAGEASVKSLGQDGEQDLEKEQAMSKNGSSDGPISGRADAYQRLGDIADYLMRTEPHSPVPYLIRRAVDWGDMSFGELLMVLMAEDGDKARLLRLLGLDDMGKKD